MSDILTKLAAPFPPARISWRVGSTNGEKTKGMALAYIDSRDVQDRLDQVCGPNWQCRYPHAAQKTVCDIGIKIGDEWIWRADGAGDTDVEQEKGALSDAFKRAAVKWGIGRYLYEIDCPWVAIVARGRSYVIAENEGIRLQKLLPGSKAETAPVEKSAPGVSEAKTWAREHVRELNACEGPEDFMEAVSKAALRWIKICAVYPAIWEGPDGAGLRGEGRKLSVLFQCEPAYTVFLKDVEAQAAGVRAA